MSKPVKNLIAADYKDGVLTVRLPIREASKARVVPVSIAS